MHYLTDDLNVVFDETGTFSGLVLGKEKSEAIVRLVSISVSLLEQKKRVFDILKIMMPPVLSKELENQTLDIDQKLTKLASEIQSLR